MKSMITFIANSDKSGSSSLCCLCFVLYDALCQPYWLALNKKLQLVYEWKVGRAWLWFSLGKHLQIHYSEKFNGVGVYHGSDCEYCLLDVTPRIDIPEEAAASINRISCIKAAGSCAMSVHIYQIKQCHIPRQSNLHTKCKLQFLGLC